jgi:hypothetical protein
MEKIIGLLNELRAGFPQYALMRVDVSAADAGWHLEHSMLVIRRAYRAVLDSDPAVYRPNYSIRTYLFFNVVKKIPRGRTKAPAAVVPAPGITEDTLHQSFDKTMLAIADFEKAGAKQYFHHRLLGNLDRDRTRLLMELHTRHHLDIIRDIAGEG